MISSTDQKASEKTTLDKKVLVLGHDVRFVLPIVRSLGRRGIITDLAWCSAKSPATRSRYIRHLHKIALPELQDNSWIGDLRELIQTHRYDLVIPAAESFVFFLQQHRTAFEEFGSVCLMDDEVFQTAFDKMKSWDLAHSLNIPVPDSEICRNIEELDRFLQSATYPLILKPDCSVNPDTPSSKNYVMTARCAQDARKIFRNISSNGSRIHLQTLVSGIGVGVEFLANQGELLAVHQHKRLHETSGHGSTYRESVAVSPELYQATEKIIKELNYTGVGMAEFRVDDDTGQWWFLELNARFWGSLPLAVASGVDFPFYLYELLVEGRTTFNVNSRDAVRCRNLRNDLRWTGHWLRQHFNSQAVVSAQQSGWNVNSISFTRCVWDWLRLLTLQDHQDVFAWDDLSPSFWEARQILSSLQRKIIPGKKSIPSPISRKTFSMVNE